MCQIHLLNIGMGNVLSPCGLALENVFLIFASNNYLLTQRCHFLRPKIITEFGEISATSILGGKLEASQKVKRFHFRPHSILTVFRPFAVFPYFIHSICV